MVVPFINGVFFGIGELYANEFVYRRLKWRGAQSKLSVNENVEERNIKA
jgi:hypothetical protein